MGLGGTKYIHIYVHISAVIPFHPQGHIRTSKFPPPKSKSCSSSSGRPLEIDRLNLNLANRVLRAEDGPTACAVWNRSQQPAKRFDGWETRDIQQFSGWVSPPSDVGLTWRKDRVLDRPTCGSGVGHSVASCRQKKIHEGHKRRCLSLHILALVTIIIFDPTEGSYWPTHSGVKKPSLLHPSKIRPNPFDIFASSSDHCRPLRPMISQAWWREYHGIETVRRAQKLYVIVWFQVGYAILICFETVAKRYNTFYIIIWTPGHMCIRINVFCMHDIMTSHDQFRTSVWIQCAPGWAGKRTTCFTGSLNAHKTTLTRQTICFIRVVA